MTHRAGADFEMRGTMPATLKAGEVFLADFRMRTVARLDAANGFAAELLMREALTNAVVHGCHADPGKQVRCCVRLNDVRLLIAVEDDGAGFDWRAAWARQAGRGDCSGRGVEILHRYASRVRYNAGGNGVTLIRRFVEEKHQ